MIDHSKAVKDVMKAGINCYATKATFQATNQTGHRAKVIELMKQFSIKTWNILPFKTEHDCEGSCGFLLQSGNEKLLFCTDSAYIEYKFSGLTHLMIECNYQEYILKENIKNGSISTAQKNRLLFSHMSLDTLLEFLRANDLSKLKSINLLHLSAGNSDVLEMKEAVQKLTGKQVFIAG